LARTGPSKARDFNRFYHDFGAKGARNSLFKDAEQRRLLFIFVIAINSCLANQASRRALRVEDSASFRVWRFMNSKLLNLQL
jgi:hypothetical protein